ncbi:MAG: SDR family NAD(P)-dependent oxidoreductase [Candidatus Sericytochromatia bacterium]|nr:SDR family NAD(P)-dependent oxidoreductase [Candidatus Sericytochromatia bacterium]
MLARKGTVLIVGAGSPIARALGVEFAREGFDLCLAGRDVGEMRTLCADFQIRFGVRATPAPFDALLPDPGEQLAPCWSDETVGVVVAFGLMHDQRTAEANPHLALEMLHVNFTAAALVCETATRELLARGGRWLCVLGSVAGDRGRQSNYLYGGAKGGLAIYAQGLQHRLASSGLKVIFVKPGFLDTGMTWGKPGLFGVASPEKAARFIRRAIAQGVAVSYVPSFWYWLMMLIRAVPRLLFERTKL